MHEELRVVPGTLLAAWPDLEDPNFRRAVVLMCHHNQEGAYGLITNRVAPMTVCDLLPDHPSLGSGAAGLAGLKAYGEVERPLIIVTEGVV